MLAFSYQQIHLAPYRPLLTVRSASLTIGWTIMGEVSPGQRIGNYRVVVRIGEGGMATVYEAVHEQIGRRAAIKVLKPRYSEDPEIAQRFLNEARAVNLLDHAGIVEIYDFGKLE